MGSEPTREISDAEREAIWSRVPAEHAKDYFAERLRAGDRPKYGYPPNHLPKTTCPPMKIVTSFVAARAAGK
jgi:hypothetical protein